jgi:hypothetical protein
MAEKSGIAVGLNKGRVVATRKLAARPAQRKGKLGKRVKNIRELIRDVVGACKNKQSFMGFAVFAFSFPATRCGSRASCRRLRSPNTLRPSRRRICAV